MLVMKRIIIFIFLLASFVSKAQYKTTIGIDSFPVPSTLSAYTFITSKGDTTYLWSIALQKWIPISGGSGSGILSLSANINGSALSLSGSPINSSSGTLTFGWTGLSNQYVKGNGSLGTFSTDIQTIGDARYSLLGHTHSGLAPIGGTTGQILKKNSNTDYDYSWQNEGAGYVPVTRTITINGVTQDLSVDRSWTVSGGSSLKVDSVTTNSDSTILQYWVEGTAYEFYDFTKGLTGSDTTIFETVIDSTGQPGQRVLYASGNKIRSTPYFIFDSANRKLVIGNQNISVGGPNTKLWVTGNANITGNLTANSFIKQGGTSSQFLKADGSVDGNTYLTTSDLTSYQLISNLSTSTSLGTSNTLYPSQNAVKTYVDSADANNVKLTGNQTINGVKTFNDEVHSYGGFSVVDPNGSLETAFLTYENVSGTYGGGLKLRSTGGNSNTLYAATTLSTNRTNRLPNVTGTLANSVTVNGTNYTSDGNGVIDIGTITSGGSGTVNSGTQYRIGYYAGTGTAISEAPAITGNRALISDANGVPTHSTVTATELAHLIGVTSPIEGQLDSKEAAFLSGSEEFTGSTSMSVTIANTPLSTKEESYYLNGLVIKAANISRVGTTVTFTGFVRESSDIITAKYSYLAP